MIGHYTLAGTPKVLSNKVVCVDYNAAKDDNPLVCYQFDLGYLDKSCAVTNDFFHYSNKPK